MHLTFSDIIRVTGKLLLAVAIFQSNSSSHLYILWHLQTICSLPLSYLFPLSYDVCWRDNYVSGPISGIDLHFDDPTSGYLIKETTSNSQEDGSLGGDEPSLSSKFVSNLTVFGSQRSVDLKASHGPFLSSQTIAVSTFLGRLSMLTWLAKLFQYLQRWT